MRRYGRAVQDLLIILITVSALALVASASINSDSGNSDLDDNVAAFLDVQAAEVDDSVSLSDLEDSLSQDVPSIDVSLPTDDAASDDAPVAVDEPAPDPEPAADPAPASEPTPAPEPVDSDTDEGTAKGPVAAQEYIIKEGDTYGCIAEAVYGSYENWPTIAAANPGIGFQERRLFVGNTLTIPEVTSPKPSTSLCQ